MTTSNVLHVLPGDAMVESFRASGIPGDFIVCRECLVDGDISGESLEEFWANRARFVTDAFGASDYDANVRDQLLKLKSAAGEVNLWFGDELFCQVNYWFCLSLLADRPVCASRVAPLVENPTCIGETDPTAAFTARSRITKSDFELGRDLWNAFRLRDAGKLTALGRSESNAFPRLGEIVDAAVGMDEKNDALIRRLLAEGWVGFADVYREFTKRAPVYGFGDAQVRRLFDRCQSS